MERKLRVNAGKTKIMIYGTGLDLLQSSGTPFTLVAASTGFKRNAVVPSA